MPDFAVLFSLLECKKPKIRSHDKRKKQHYCAKICTENRINMSLKDLSIDLNIHGRHGLLSFLSFISISVLHNLELETYTLYNIANKLYKAALLTRYYVQHFHGPYVDSEVNHKRNLVKISFINKGYYFV